MRSMRIEITPDPLDEDVVAAALAAIALYTEAAPGPAAPARPVWRTAAVLAAQGIAPSRAAPPATWAAAERIGRAARWSGGALDLFD